MAEALHAAVAGSGTEVLLIMGFSMTGAMWAPLLPALSARHRCATYDHRGTGASPDGAPDTMAALAADALGVLDALGWARAHVVGVSMGGMVAQELALAAPERLRSLALLATHPGGPGAILPTPAGLAALLAPAPAPWKLARLLYPRPVRERLGAAEVARRTTEQLGLRVPPATRRAQLRAIRAHDTRARLGRITAPTLVVEPGADRLVRPTHSARLAAAIPGARRLVLPDAGHGLVHSHAGPLSEALLEHFAAAERAAGAPARLR